MGQLFGEAELAMMRARHPRPGQFERAARACRALVDRYDDVSFTPPVLGRIEAETLIVFRDRNPFDPVSLAFDLCVAIPRSRLWVVPDGHAPVFGTHALRFAETARAFLRG
ncbi:MAG TPA: hypothetical protein VNK41_01640 [Vicinamibacterales bacterium]|nr:hypothetical protein [Vicinamibacterales bacterium]